MAQGLWSRLFPVPRALSMRGGGIEISESTVKFFRFDRRGGTRALGGYGQEPLPEGTIVRGEIHNEAALVEVLRKVRARANFALVHASLPEQKGYLFDLTLQRDSATPLSERVALALPEHVPLSPAEAVYDCETVFPESTMTSRSIAVTVLPEEVAHSYAQVLEAAGFFPVSFELEPQAAARAILYGEPKPQGAHLFVDFGAGKTVISVVQNGTVRFATSADGSGEYDEKLAEAAPEQKSVEDLKDTEGLTSGTQTEKVFSASAAQLAKSLDRVRIYWQLKPEHGEHREPISSIVLYGGNANVHGLIEYVARTLNIPCRAADLRAALIDAGERVPPIHQSEALRYATVIGLALRPFVMPW